ncbi:hypothetical protein VTN49DRAFT_2343 [Thermomyces lanuginosus]|uniref:uncharacterized protein n=1 Tax=Thermomyces lanuginosus TaxID=5541 RepID=UPI003744A7ED
MTKTTVQEQATTATNNTTVNVEYENDSTYWDELSSYSASLTSSVLNYRHENGRRYHKYRDGSYLLPNDEPENDRLDMVHEMCLVMLHRKLYLAPIKNPQQVIDLATGTSLWAIDFADQHPQAEIKDTVIGCDLRPIQPTLVPPNVKFLVDDIESDWAYERNPFDYIHARFLALSIKNYEKVIRECYRSVKPGGWVEFQDWDVNPTSEDGSLKGIALERYYITKSTAPSRGRGKHPRGENCRFLRCLDKDKYLSVFIPFMKLGAWNQAQAEANGFEAGALAVLTRYKNWSKEEVTVLASQARADGQRRDIHMVHDFYIVYGQRPED